MKAVHGYFDVFSAGSALPALPVLDELTSNQIVGAGIDRKSGMVLLCAGCDKYFAVEMNPDVVRTLSSELLRLAALADTAGEKKRDTLDDVLQQVRRRENTGPDSK